MRRDHKILIQITCEDEQFEEALMQEIKYILIGPKMSSFGNGSHGGFSKVTGVSTGHNYEVYPQDAPKVYDDSDDEDFTDYDD